MTILTAADYADTGQWRLRVDVYADRMTAHLENTLHDGIEPQRLFAASWEKDSGQLLRNIENAVYDNPRVLEDFAACITLYDPHTLFMPTELLAETEGQEETYYTEIYDAEPSDVMCQSDGDVTAAFTIAPGLKGFLGRTFPGARITCNLMNQFAEMRGSGGGYRLRLTLREGEMDLVLVRDRDLVSASTQAVTGDGDVAYHAFNLMEVYGVNPKEVQVTAYSTSGLPDGSREMLQMHAGGLDEVTPGLQDN